MTVELLRPEGVLAGFHATFSDPGASGLAHAGEQWAPTSLFIGRHRHRTWELYLQAHGTSRWEVGSASETLRPGGFLAVPPGVAHTMAERPSARHHFFYAAVHLSAVLARRPALAPAWTPGRARIVAQGGALEAPFRQLIREVTAGLPQSDEGLELAVDVLVLEASRLGAAPAGPSAAVVHPAVQTARELLDQSYDRRWTAAELASRTGMSQNYLTELFSRDVGLSPHQYLVQRRLSRAVELLEQTDLPITRIAVDLGFSSASHFARVFRRHAGRTPRSVRERAGGRDGLGTEAR